jgi:RHS repeat-associated protein
VLEINSINTHVNQYTDYYPFGGKELDEMHGLNWYDFQARQLSTAIPRFTTLDPLAEKYYAVSPYAYCGNNPVNRIDPTGMDWFTDIDGTYQYNPDINKNNQAEKLKEGQTYIGVTHQIKDKNGKMMENYRKDGSIMYFNESSGYKRIWNNSQKTGNEEMGVIINNGVFVVPDYKNTASEVNLTNYGYSVKDGNVVDANGTTYNTVATVHTHPDGSGPSLYVLNPGGGGSWGDLGFAANRTPYKPVFVLQNDGKNTISIIMSASANGRLTENFNRYTVQNITGGMPSVNINSIQKGTSLRQFTRTYSSYLRSFYNK